MYMGHLLYFLMVLFLSLTLPGHLRVVFDFGFERQELIFPGKHFGLGQYHEVRITRKDSGSKLIMTVRRASLNLRFQCVGDLGIMQ
jgi:hypothetical protein